jgi:DNA mismatch repair protein MutL
MAAKAASAQENKSMMHHPVCQLSADVARKIAAGEVIDRPCAIVRELMDNAVDSGADTISVEIDGGGIDKVRIADNGTGMTRDDLVLCARPHATSKISDEKDLLNLTTLGFRGEALSSIAAVARLSIASGTNKMRASITEDHIIESIPPVQDGHGTIVTSEGLFENFPARRLFLKRPASETMLCRETFIEKTLPRTDISFRLTIDGQLRYDLPKDVTLSERFVQALELKEESALFPELKGSSPVSASSSSQENSITPSVPDWSFRVIIGEPSVYRNDRKNIYIYVNGRRINEYSLMQAIEYGAQGYFPNGVHPVAALFVDMNPSLVDFNIHPAKKEVRFKDSAPLHHAVSSAIRSFFRSYGIKSTAEEYGRPIQSEFSLNDADSSQSDTRVADSTDSFRTARDDTFRNDDAASPHTAGSFEIRHNSQLASSLADNALDGTPHEHNETTRSATRTTVTAPHTAADSAPDMLPDSDGFRYIGTALGVFLIAEVRNTLYLIDQHAAHERILFNKILAAGGQQQELLIPYTVTTSSSSDDAYLKSIQEPLRSAGFTCKDCGNGTWEFSAVPITWKGTEADLARDILDKRVKPEEIGYHMAATNACKAAVKDGYVLDRDTATRLAKDALSLSDPHCPHGRPIWTTITKEELFARVRRT